MSIWSNFKKRGFKDWSWKRARIYARFLYYKIKGTSYPELLVPEYVEQIAHRMSNVGCRQCLEAGACVICKCNSPELFYDKDFECEGKNWNAMLPPEEWRESGIEVDKSYVEQVEKYGRIKKFD